MPTVPITPMRPLRVVDMAVRTAGPITSTTGTSYLSRASRSIAADAVLHAITSIFTPCSTSVSSTSSAYLRTSAIGLGP